MVRSGLPLASVTSVLLTSTLLGTALADRGGRLAAGGDETGPPLPRWREGGTPYDPNQSLFPYAIETVVAAAPETGLIESPPEYGPSRGVLFRYSTGAWPSVVRACVKALTGDPAQDDIAYVVVASQSAANSAAAAFASDGADLSKVVFLIHPTNSIWLRDYGPHFVWQDSTLAIVDSHYYPNRGLDNFIPTLIGQDSFVMPTYDIPLYYSGGNFLVGPNRSGFKTALVNLDNPASQGFSPSMIQEFFGRFKGIETLHVLPQLPFSVDGTGHIDMWMYIIDEQNVVISQFLPGSNATAISVTNNAVPYMENLGFTVHRPPAWNSGGTHFTYANAFRVNDRIFIPAYGNILVPGGNSAYNQRDLDALAIWQAAAGPDVEIIPIQCSSIITAAGAIHCIVKQVPRYVDTMPSATVLAPSGGDVWLAGTTETIRWNATDTNNVALASVDLNYSLDGGQSWTPIASGLPDTGSYDWLVPSGASDTALIQVVVQSTGGSMVAAASNPYRHRLGTQTIYDFSAGAGVSKFGWGHQTTAWSGVGTNPVPVTTGLTSSHYAALAFSDAIGGSTTNPNRFNSPTVSSSARATHLFRFVIDEDPSSIDELVIRWEGFAERCTQIELYVWDRVAGQWGDGNGLFGQNRFADSYAGNRDSNLYATVREDIDRLIAPDGTLRVMMRTQRTGDRSFHDYMSVTVKQADPIPACPADLTGDGFVGGADLGVLLAAWGPCPGCPEDLNGDGFVGGADLGILLSAWGACE
jgi:agmatine deiminase